MSNSKVFILIIYFLNYMKIFLTLPNKLDYNRFERLLS